VGTLNASDKVLLQSGEMTVGEFAKQLELFLFKKVDTFHSSQ
jgi:hypothetical protein